VDKGVSVVVHCSDGWDRTAQVCCDTYPRQIYVPKEATTLMLISSSRFRSKGRLPALTYLHNNKVGLTLFK